MEKPFKKLFKKLFRTIPGIILLIAGIIYLILIIGSLYHYGFCKNITPFLHLNKGQLVTYGVGFLAAIIVFFQIVSLQEQLQVQTLVEYSRQWSSSEMVDKRKSAMNVLKFDDVTGIEVELEKLEQVLELLEDFSGLADDGVLDEDLVWESSLGWYASRYFFYSNRNKSIEAVRKKWGLTDEPDMTYYKKLETLYKRYLNNEAANRKIDIVRIECGYVADKGKFIHGENADASVTTKEDFKPILIELRRSNINGVGVFATKKIAEKQFIAEGIHKADYDDLVSWEEAKSFDEDTRKKIHDFCIGTPGGFIPPEDKDFSKLSVEWYMNHSCNGNVGFNEDGDFVAIKEIGRDEELTYDYGLAESNPHFIMDCKCGNSNCRKTITGDYWRNQEFRKNNFIHMLPALRKRL